MGERCNSCLSSCFKTNFSRDLWFLLLMSISVVLTLAVLASASSNPTSSMSWSKFTAPSITVSSGNTCDLLFNVGLINTQVCCDGACVTSDVGTIPTIGSDATNGGKAVITALTFSMLFALAAILVHFLYTFGRAEKLRYPRIVLYICSFMALNLQIVSVASWYQYVQDKIPSILYESSNGKVSNVSNGAPGYAVAVNIIVIALIFFAWGFSLWRTCRPVDGGAGLGSNFSKSHSAEGMSSPKYETQRSESALETGKKQFAAAAFKAATSPSHNSADNTYSNSYGNNGSAYGNNGGGYNPKSPSSAYGY